MKNRSENDGRHFTRQQPDNGKRELMMLHWGLIPFWSDGLDEQYKMINALPETGGEKPAYRAAFKKGRCLIVADGFYEWKPTDDKKNSPISVTCRTIDRLPSLIHKTLAWENGTNLCGLF